MVAVGAVGVFNTLRRTFVIHTRLPWKTIARERSVITVAIIVNGPDTDGAYGWEVELIIEGKCPLISLFSPAQINAVSRIRSLRTASSTLNKATLASRPTLPEATAVL